MEQLMEQMETVKNNVGMHWKMVKLGDVLCELDAALEMVE